MAISKLVSQYEAARAALLEFKALSAKEQRARQAEIEQAFLNFWAGQPSREEFRRTIDGLPLTADMLYVMVKR